MLNKERVCRSQHLSVFSLRFPFTAIYSFHLANIVPVLSYYLGATFMVIFLPFCWVHTDQYTIERNPDSKWQHKIQYVGACINKRFFSSVYSKNLIDFEFTFTICVSSVHLIVKVFLSCQISRAHSSVNMNQNVWVFIENLSAHECLHNKSFTKLEVKKPKVWACW